MPAITQLANRKPALPSQYSNMEQFNPSEPAVAVSWGCVNYIIIIWINHKCGLIPEETN